jgi:signal peptidase I
MNKKHKVETKRKKSLVRELAEIIIPALLLYLFIHIFLQTVQVDGESMFPNLHNGDYLIASKMSYKVSTPHRGDIVIFLPNNGDPRDYIKRVIAIPGDKLQINNAQVFINGKKLHEDYLNETWIWKTSWNNGTPTILGANQYFVMGDNRNNSTDSRIFGTQNKEQFLGNAWVRLWPLSNFEVFAPDSKIY